ncbi:MAG: DNA polymerase IV [Myxococcales bacterium]|nr:DNA polymerase IV [Myxococcales bacterium]
MATAAPRISCLDLDTFFVSVERVLDPSLEGKPVIVGGRPGQRGVVTACSYEVRALGVRSGMSLTEAGKLAPDAIYLPVRGGTYSEYAEGVREIAARYTPVIRVASIDELFMDFRGCERLYHRAGDADHDATILRVVCELTAAIKRELSLPASAGIATSKSLAKVASGLAKPAGVLLVPAGAEAQVLAPLPVRKLPGIGPVAEAKLARVGITQLGQVASTPLPKLRRIFGAWAETVKLGATGQGSAEMGRDRPAFREHDPEGEVIGSISNERTFREDVRDRRTIDRQLCGLTERVCWRARNRGVKARTVTLKLRYADFHTITRSRTVTPTDSELELYPVVQDLYRKGRVRRLPIRLLGLALSNLGLYDTQLPLFPGSDRLHETVDAIRDKYGFDALRLAEGRD